MNGRSSIRIRYAWRTPVVPVTDPDNSKTTIKSAVNHPCILCLVSGEYGRCEKVFWSIAALCLSFVMLFISYNLIVNYIQRPIIISIDNIDGTLQGAVFPAVTICNLNWRHLSIEWLVSNEIRQEATWALLPQNITHLSEELDVNGTSAEIGNSTEIGNNTETTLLFTNMTLLRNVTITQHERAKMLLRCTWRSQIVNCSDIFQSTVTEMGVCSTFNYGFPEKALKELYTDHLKRELFQVEGIGLHNGLGILLDAKEGRHLQERDAVGFRVVVHPPQEVPLESRAFLVSPGTLTSAKIHVHQTVTSDAVMNQWPAQRQKNCYTDTERELRHYTVYSEANCFMECVRDAILDKCDCALPSIPADDSGNTSTSVCILKEQNDCARKIIDKLQVSKEQQYVERRTHCQCQRKCSSLKYETSVSVAKFPGKDALPRLRKEQNKSDEYIKGNFVELQLYFSDASYMQYTRDVSSSVSELFGSVGGIIGGVLGCSLVTVCDVLFLVTRWRWRRRRNFFKPPKEIFSA